MSILVGAFHGSCLGQRKRVQVKKFVFRNCIAREQYSRLDKEIAASCILISNGFYPPEAVKILAKNVRPQPPVQTTSSRVSSTYGATKD
jgi:hypothetical protein